MGESLSADYMLPLYDTGSAEELPANNELLYETEPSEEPAERTVEDELCGNRPDCPVANTKRGCPAVDEHHIFWPESSYKKNKHENTFRTLPENKVLMCRWGHEVLHKDEKPPLKPSLDAMKEAINREMQRRREAAKNKG